MARWRRAIALVVPLLLIISCTSTSAPSPQASGASPAAVKTVDLLKIGTTQDESSWNPYTYSSGSPGWQVLLMQFDTLMAGDLDNVPQPWLAKDVQASAVSGAVVVETVFAYPGIGRMLFEAVLARDYPLLQAGFILATFTVIAANAHPFLDPRVRAHG